MSHKAIETKELVKIYSNGVKAVDGVSFEVERGEIFGFLGPNGAGKTTTISILVTLIQPTSGHALVAGYDVKKEPAAVRNAIGYVSQDIAVDEDLTGYENLLLQAGFYHLPQKIARKRIEELLSLMELEEAAHRLVSQYSGGMRKRLDIAGGLLHEPEILFLDEPTLGLDIQTRRIIWDYIFSFRKKGMTIFLTTHYMEEADTLCDRVAIIDHGKIKAIGSPAELKKQIGGDIIELKLASPFDLSQLALEKLSFVNDVTAFDNQLSLVVAEGEKVLPSVLAYLKNQGVEVMTASIKKVTLDDVFLHHTGRALRDDEEDSDFHRTSLALRRARK